MSARPITASAWAGDSVSDFKYLKKSAPEKFMKISVIYRKKNLPKKVQH
jgi:hypothetical protein